MLFRSHFGFDAFYCQPGIAGAHEKGGVEGDVGRFRRQHLVPMPVVDSLDELNEKVRALDAADDRRRISSRIRTVGEDFATERENLAPLPVEGFDPGLMLNPMVDRSAMITVRMARYSVPARFIHRRVRVSLRASEVVVFDGRLQIARHARVITRGGQSVNLDHYLEVLKGKPGALPGSTALAQARESGAFTPAHEAFWANARRRLGDAVGTRELIDVLLLHRAMAADEVEAGLLAAVSVGAVSADVVAVEARLHTTSQRPPGPVQTVIPLRSPAMANDEMATPSAAGRSCPSPNACCSTRPRSSPASRPTPGRCRRWRNTSNCSAAAPAPTTTPTR